MSSEMKKFKCPRCGRVWWSSVHTDMVRCICEMDCEYHGGEQTVTTLVSKSGLIPKSRDEPYYENSVGILDHVEPAPWNTTHGPCTVCGHYQGLPIVYAIPTDD